MKPRGYALHAEGVICCQDSNVKIRVDFQVRPYLGGEALLFQPDTDGLDGANQADHDPDGFNQFGFQPRYLEILLVNPELGEHLVHNPVHGAVLYFVVGIRH